MARKRQGKRARAREAVLHKLAPYKRLAWLPITAAGDGALEASKFCGTPSLARQDAWPRCPNCTEPMRCLLQLNLSQVPEPCRGQFGQGLLQMLYCDNQREEDGSPAVSLWADRCDGADGFRRFTQNRLVRLLKPMPRAPTSEDHRGPNLFPPSNFGGAVWTPRQIIGWQEVVDYPELLRNFTEGPAVLVYGRRDRAPHLVRKAQAECASSRRGISSADGPSGRKRCPTPRVRSVRHR